MKISTIALAGAISLTSTFAFAQMGGANGNGANVPEYSGTPRTGQGYAVRPGYDDEHRTAGMGNGAARRLPDDGGPNGYPDGPTSLSGTGSSQYGGRGSPGAANGR